jgi:hypothetical protein
VEEETTKLNWYIIFDVLKALDVKRTVVWTVTPCPLLDRYHIFAKEYYLMI